MQKHCLPFQTALSIVKSVSIADQSPVPEATPPKPDKTMPEVLAASPVQQLPAQSIVNLTVCAAHGAVA